MKRHVKPCGIVTHLLCTTLLFMLVSISAKSQLRADFSVDHSAGCSPLLVSFTNTTSGATSSAVYSWNFGNGNLSSQKNPGAVFTDEKIYTVTLTVRDGNQTSTKSQTITVYKKPSIAFTNEVVKGCSPVAVDFTVTAEAGDGDMQSLFWDFGDGSTSEMGPASTVSHTFSVAQYTPVLVTATNSFGCQSTFHRDSVVHVLKPLIADFRADSTIICRLMDPAKLTNLSSGPGTLEYSWSLGDGSTSSSKDINKVYSARGTYTIALEVKSSEGCTTTKTKTDYLNIANFVSDLQIPSLICSGTRVDIINNPSPQADRTQFHIPDVGYSFFDNQNSWTFSAPNAGAHTLTAITHFGGCTDTTIRVLTVKQTPELKGFDKTLPNFCALPATVALRDTTPAAVSWSWDFTDDGIVNTDVNTREANYIVNNPGRYFIRLGITDTTGCSNSTGYIVEASLPNVVIDYGFDEVGNNYGCPEETAFFRVRSEHPIASYKWTFSDDNTTSTEAAPRHKYSREGYFVVTLEYTTEKGCTGIVQTNNIFIQQKPAADFASLSGTVICGNTPVVFNATGTGFTDGYWDFGDGSFVQYRQGMNNQRIQHKYESEGEYTVRFVSANNGCRDTITKTNYIKVSPPFPDIAGYVNTCEGTRGEVTLYETSRQANSWSWNFGDGSAPVAYNSFRDSIKHTFAESGAYNVVLTTTNGACTVSDSMAVTVLIKQRPTMRVTPATVCVANRFELFIENYDVNPRYYYYWEQYTVQRLEYRDTAAPEMGYAAGSDYSGPDIKWGVFPYTTGEYTFRAITESYYFGCMDTSNYVSVNITGPTANFGFQTSFCVNDPVLFTDSSIAGSSPIVKWDWDFGDGTDSRTTGAPFSRFIQRNDYGTYVNLKVTDADGCTSHASVQTIHLENLQASFYPSSDIVSPGTQISFHNTTEDPHYSLKTYRWDFGDGNYSSEEHPKHTYTRPGTYTVRLIVNSDMLLCVDTATATIIVKYINSDFSMDASYLSNRNCPPMLVRFTNTSSNPHRVRWEFGDGAIADNVLHPSHVYHKPGAYEVILHVYSDNGAHYSTRDSVFVKTSSATLVSDIEQACTSQTITFSAEADSAVRYAWDLGDGTMMNTADSFALHQFSKPGLYFPKLVLVDKDGCTTTASSQVDILIDSLDIALDNLPNVLCDSADIHFIPTIFSVSQSQDPDALSFAWDFGTGIPGDNSAAINPEFSYKAPGRYQLSLKVSSAAGCQREIHKEIVVNEMITGTIQGPGEICQGSTASFRGYAPSNNVNWNWNFGGTASYANQNPPAQVFTTAGTYPVRLIVEANGCKDTSIANLVVHALPRVDMAQDEVVLCAGSAVQLQAGGGTAYQWFPSVGLSNDRIANPVATPSATTTYVVAATSSFGCSATDSIRVLVASPFTLQVPPDTLICAGASLPLRVSGAENYSWINNTAGLSSTIVGNPIARPGTSTVYTVRATDRYNCFSETADINVTVMPLPTVDAGADIELTGAVSHQFTPVASSDVVSWNWSPPDYLNCISCPNPVSTPLRETEYAVTVRTEHNCIASDKVVIRHHCSENAISISNAFTPGQIGRNRLFGIAGKGNLKVRYFRIYNRWGQVIFERNNFIVNDPNAMWDGTLSGQPAAAGTYVFMAEMQCDAGNVIAKKGSLVLIR